MYISGPGTYWLGQRSNVKVTPGNGQKTLWTPYITTQWREFQPILFTGVFVFVDVVISFCDQMSRSPQAMTRKTGWIQYIRIYFRQNWVMYVPAHETYWLGQKVKGQGHSKRGRNRRRQRSSFFLFLITSLFIVYKPSNAQYWRLEILIWCKIFNYANNCFYFKAIMYTLVAL